MATQSRRMSIGRIALIAPSLIGAAVCLNDLDGASLWAQQGVEPSAGQTSTERSSDTTIDSDESNGKWAYPSLAGELRSRLNGWSRMLRSTWPDTSRQFRALTM